MFRINYILSFLSIIIIGISLHPEICHSYKIWDYDDDGISNKNDLCPKDPEDFDLFQDWDGAPDPDNDNDGIPDVMDGAPNDPEDIDGWEDDDGVRDIDNDGDGIPDLKDGAPNEPENFNGYMDEDGIPDKKPEVKYEINVCPKCGKSYPFDYNYCEDDGTKLEIKIIYR